MTTMKTNRSSKKPVLVAATIAALIIPSAAMSGCELAVDFDRGKIVGPEAGATDATVGDATGGNDATMDGSNPPVDSGKDAAADTGVDAKADTGVDSGVDSGMDAGMDAGCMSPSDCPPASTDCDDPTCTAGACGTSHKTAGNACTSNGGTVCDGSGACVACLKDGDCGTPTTVCATPTCDTAAHTCGVTNAAKGTACTDSGGTVCDGNGMCVAAHCNDGVMDADETDKDCGGTSCSPCADTKGCKVGTDCVNKICTVPGGQTVGTCAVPTCADGVQNGNETDKDCGGGSYNGAAACGKCADLKHCAANSDCVNGDCSGSSPGTCVSCMDGVKDGSETDTDCGGAVCDVQSKLCALNKGCGASADCQSSFCGSGNTCQLKPGGTACSANGECSSNACGVAGTGNCCTAACSPTGGTCGATACDTSGACVFPSTLTACGTQSCSNGQLTTAGTCSGTGSCNAGTTAACPGDFACANATSCKTACSSNNDCVSGFVCQNPGASGTCVSTLAAGSACSANSQCSSGKCGTTGSGHCCTASCSATVAACGATDCDTNGACVYPGNTVAPASLQTPGDCQKVVCNGSGGATSADDPTDLPGPASTICLINPSCQGPSPLTPHYDPAPTSTDCSADGMLPDHVCGNTSNSNIAGTCVQCNQDADCLVMNDAGTEVCDTTRGTCGACVPSGDSVASAGECSFACCNGGCSSGTTCQ